MASALTLAACGSSGNGPSDTFQISCSVNREVETPDGQPVTVDYAAPTTTGATGQVTTSCAPASGTKFSIGTTTVVCNASQAGRPTVQCDFRVTVARRPELAVTKFMAFGDSITLGSLSPCSSAVLSPASAGVRFHLRGLDQINLTVGPQFSYPTVLKNLLSARYGQQASILQVGNEGKSGETVTDLAGSMNDQAFNRMKLAILADRPQVVFLQEGVNDINNQIPQQLVANALRSFVREIKLQGAQPLIGTLLPEAGFCRGPRVNAIPPANDAIRVMAAEEGVPVIDFFQGFNGVAGPYIGPDGLHPNEIGYQKMAEIAFGVVRERFEVK